MIHELIEPRKKTNKTISSTKGRQKHWDNNTGTKTLQDNRPFSDHFTFELSDSENKEAESSSTTNFIPPWLRNSLGLNQRNNQSHAAAGHSDQKSGKIIQRYKGPNQNEFELLKANVEGDCCKKVADQFETLSSCPQEEDPPASADEKDFFNSGDGEVPVHWEVRHKQSNTDSSCANTDTRSFEKEDLKMITTDVVTVPEMGNLKDEEKRKTRFVRQRSKLRKRCMSEQRPLELNKNDENCSLEMKAREVSLTQHPSAEMKQLETKLRLLVERDKKPNNAVLNPQEQQLLQDLKEQVGSTGDFDLLLKQAKEINLQKIIKNSNLLTDSTGDKKMHGKEMAQNYNDDSRSTADKDSLLSTDDENDIKRFSEFLSKNKNAEEKRKCLEEVRNYFERKRRTRLSKRRYLEEVKSKLGPEIEKKDRQKSKEPFTVLPNRGRKSKFALCDEEVVEKAVDETLQKFVELYHFHVPPKVMGNMKKNILQVMQSDSMESSCSKMNLVEAEYKSEEEKIKKGFLNQKDAMRSFLGLQVEGPEMANIEMPVQKEARKKTFKSLIISSNERLQKHSKEIDVVENERLKHLNREFENFLYSIQNHIEVSNLKIQSVILEKEDHGSSSKNMQFVYNFAKNALETERVGLWQPVKEESEVGKETLEDIRMCKEIGVQASLKREALKKSVRIQVMDYPKTCEQSLQTEEKRCISQAMQTESESVPFRDLKELKSFEIKPGLYRMVKSSEAGKFYLYPEQQESEKGQLYEKSNSAVVKDKKYNRKRDLLNILSRERTKERRIYFREKEKGKLKKSRKAMYAVAHLKEVVNKREKLEMKENGWEGAGVKKTDSVNCLYFRNLDGKNSESLKSRKEFSSRNASAIEAAENLGFGDSKEEEHLGCVWYWNGKKINPGCDLKMHVEDLLKEKLKEMSNWIDPLQIKTLVNDLTMAKDNGEAVSEATTLQKNVNMDKNTGPCFRHLNNCQKENQVSFTNEVGSLETTDKIPGKNTEEIEEVKEAQMSVSQEVVRSVATQNSQQTILSFNMTKTRTQSRTALSSTRKKHYKHNVVVKPSTRRFLKFKKAEEILRAVEEIKNLKLKLENSRRDDSHQSESILGVSPSSSSSKNDVEDSLSLVLGLSTQARDSGQKPNPKIMSKKMIGVTNHEVQVTDHCDPEDANSEVTHPVTSVMDSYKHLELIENVLSKVNQKERENLWNDVREFLKTKIGRDIEDDGAREVCIEIEQDMPKHEHGTLKQAVLARGHYVRNEGDVEVEIDLTLDDLEKILRQRQRRIRRQHAYRRKNKRLISSSSFQSDLTVDEMRRCQKHLNRFTGLGGRHLTEDPLTSRKKK